MCLKCGSFTKRKVTPLCHLTAYCWYLLAACCAEVMLASERCRKLHRCTVCAAEHSGGHNDGVRPVRHAQPGQGAGAQPGGHRPAVPHLHTAADLLRVADSQPGQPTFPALITALRLHAEPGRHRRGRNVAIFCLTASMQSQRSDLFP